MIQVTDTVGRTRSPALGVALTISGRIVIVGPRASELQATVGTSFSEATSRAEVHAAAIDALRGDVPLRTPPTAVLLLNLGWILPVVAPIAGLVGAAAAAVGVDYAFEVRARRRVRDVFGRFVPPAVVRDIVDAGPEW